MRKKSESIETKISGGDLKFSQAAAVPDLNKNVLNEKWKSWAVEELIAELSQTNVKNQLKTNVERHKKEIKVNESLTVPPSVIKCTQNKYQLNLSCVDKITRPSDCSADLVVDSALSSTPADAENSTLANQIDNASMDVVPDTIFEGCKSQDDVEKKLHSSPEVTIPKEESKKHVFCATKKKLGHTQSFKTKKELQRLAVKPSVSSSWVENIECVDICIRPGQQFHLQNFASKLPNICDFNNKITNSNDFTVGDKLASSVSVPIQKDMSVQSSDVVDPYVNVEKGPVQNVAKTNTSDNESPFTSKEDIPSTTALQNIESNEVPDSLPHINASLLKETTKSIPIPDQWEESFDKELGQPCYINKITKAKWFSSNDGEGRVYFFEENSNESSWTLPSISIAEDKSTSNDKGTQKHEALPNQPSADFQLRNIGTTEKSVNRAGKSHSMVLPQQKWKEDNASVTYSSRKWPELRNGDMEILKEGDLNYTKITEHGKKVRKNWTLSHIVLTEPVLLISKEPKSFQQKNALLSSSLPCPELCIDLNGAQLENPSKLSRRKHVFGVISMLGLHILIQCPNSSSMDSWLSALQKAIKNLPSEFSNRLAVQHVENLETRESDDHKRSSRVTRAKSMKIKNKEGMEDVTSSLRKFFIRRPTKEALMKKGIYKDEPVFGRNLQDVCGNERPYVPMFVKRCIEVIEKEENMKTDGLYRVSGNLSQVQKIRFQVDQNQLQVLDKEEDVHVLTGALKLFFRELKKPLIPFELYSKALEARALTDKKRLEKIKEILKPLPSCHRDTLKYLLEHLLRVTKFKDDNRMHIPNLAIVFGPTLIWSEEDKSQDMYFDMMQQNLVIECLLQNFSEIF